MSKYDEIKKEINELTLIGDKLINCLTDYSKLYDSNHIATDEERQNASYFIGNYENWYSKALIVVKQFLPDRFSDFCLLYKNDKRKAISWQNYTLSDAVQCIATTLYSPQHAKSNMKQQVSILKTCLESFDKKIFDIQTILQADIFDSEIDSAKHLMRKGFLRASGAICGVVLERHFHSVCSNRNIAISKKNPAISDYNDLLKDVAYDTVEWRRIQRLGDIRNLCDHDKNREPTKEEVEELVSGTERVIKTIF